MQAMPTMYVPVLVHNLKNITRSTAGALMQGQTET